MQAIKENNENTKNTIKGLEIKIDESKNKLEAKIDDSNKFMRNMQLTSMVGIAATVIAVVSIAISVFLGIRSVPKNTASIITNILNI